MPLNTLRRTGQPHGGLVGRVPGGGVPHTSTWCHVLLPEDFVCDFSASLPGRHPFSFGTFKHSAFISGIVPR